MAIEAHPGDTPAENRTPFGRSFSAVSTLVCVPSALAQGASEALGAQAPDQTLENVTADGGFARFQRVEPRRDPVVLELPRRLHLGENSIPGTFVPPR